MKYSCIFLEALVTFFTHLETWTCVMFWLCLDLNFEVTVWHQYYLSNIFSRFSSETGTWCYNLVRVISKGCLCPVAQKKKIIAIMRLIVLMLYLNILSQSLISNIVIQFNHFTYFSIYLVNYWYSLYLFTITNLKPLVFRTVYCCTYIQVLEVAKAKVLLCATPDAVFRLKNSYLPFLEQNRLSKLYFQDQTHGSFLEYMERELVAKKKKQLFSQVAFTIVLIDLLIQWCFHSPLLLYAC